MNDNFILFSITLYISVFLFLFFETNFIYEYLKLFKVKFKTIQEYSDIISSGSSIQYISFLRKIKNSWFWQGLTCPICLGVWISIFASLLVGSIFILPFFIFFGLFGYFVLKLLLKFSS